MITLMARVNRHFRMVPYIRVNYIQGRNRDGDYVNGQINPFIKETGKTINMMVTGNTSGKMDVNTLVSGRKA